MGLFLRQLKALCYKNWLISKGSRTINVIRCLVLPVLFILFLAEAQRFFSSAGTYGVGTQYRPIRQLNSELIGDLKFLWYDQSSNATLASSLIRDITSDLPQTQVIKVANRSELARHCPENFNEVSQCFGAIVFQTLNISTNTFAYQLRTDNGLFGTDVHHGTSSLEERHMPIQWATDSAIFRAVLGADAAPPTPVEAPYTQITQSERLNGLRLSLVRGTRSIIAIAFFIGFVGVIYHMVGFVSLEREQLLTQLLDVMGCSRVARLLSWHISFDAFYILSWLLSAVIVQQLLFTATNGALVIFFHIFFGFSIVSWSLFAAAFFKRAQLSGIGATIAAVVLAILAMVGKDAFGNVGIIVFSIIFPPASFVFGYIIFCNFEAYGLPVNMISTYGRNNSTMLAIFICFVFNIFFYFFLALYVEHWIYGHGRFIKKQAKDMALAAERSSRYSLELRNLTRAFKAFSLRKKEPFYAVHDINLKIQRGEIFCLLGANGSGKSTTLGMIAGSLGMTDGDVIVEGYSRRSHSYPAGLLSLCPQRNILWDSLTVRQHVDLWSRIKSVTNETEDIDSLLVQCDLGTKISSQSSTLSGGMKRKLQLAIAFCGDSKVVLIDEVSSGIDPLARRKLHDIVLSARGVRTQILTTHFLDEADLLADRIAVLSAGSLRAEGVPVALKSQLGRGFTLNIVGRDSLSPSSAIIQHLLQILPGTTGKTIAQHEIEYNLPTTHIPTIRQVLRSVEAQKAAWSIASYDIAGPRLEDVFLHIMDDSAIAHEENGSSTTLAPPTAVSSIHTEKQSASSSTFPIPVTTSGAGSSLSNSSLGSDPINLHSGRQTATWEQILSQCRKRWLIAKLSPWPSLSSVFVGIIAIGLSLVFLTGTPRYNATCRVRANGRPIVNLTFPYFPQFPGQPFILGPSIQTFTRPIFNNTMNNTIPSINDSLPIITPIVVSSPQELASSVQQNYATLLQGGIYIDVATQQASFSWFVLSGTFSGLSNLNLISNVLFDNALSGAGGARNATSGFRIRTSYRGFDAPSYGQLGQSLKFLIFFGVAMCVTFAFAALYPTSERLRDVKALHYSNGLTPISLHMGHLLYEIPFTALIAVIICVLYAAVVPGVIHEIGLFFVVLWIYGIVATIFSFIVALFAKSQLAAFAFAAGIQAVLFLIYVVAYLLTLTYAPALDTTSWLKYEHFSISILPIPIASIARSVMVGLNMFSLGCIGPDGSFASSYGEMLLYGGPILYLILQGIFLFGFLVWYDSGRQVPKWCSRSLLALSGCCFCLNSRKTKHAVYTMQPLVAVDPEVLKEGARVNQTDLGDVLVVRDVSKSYGSLQAVQNVSFGVASNEVFALLGPNSAGKSTTYGIIRGEVKSSSGDVVIAGRSIMTEKNAARASLGVCPQFDAMDALSVRQHLTFYARIKGLPKAEIHANVSKLIDAVSLTPFADRLARKLSGGNQRKLSLAISMIGNPAVLLIDEASSGMDIGAKRQIWRTLTKFMPGRAVVITTHSMEEADALATRVGIIAKRMLALGEISSIRRRYGDHYELAIVCAQDGNGVDLEARGKDVTNFILTHFPGASPDSERIYHGHLKFKVPITGSVASLFDTLEEHKAQLGIDYYGINRPSLESAFLKLVKQHNVVEEGYHNTLEELDVQRSLKKS